jgi:hypothetical protein
MKIAKVSLTLLAILVALLFGSRLYVERTYDRFDNTAPSFTLDKAEYRVGDTVKLSLTVQGHTTIRYFENLEHTLNVWFALRVPYCDTDEVLTYEGITADTIELRPPGSIRSIDLREGAALRLDFIGVLCLSADGGSFVLEFPALNRRFTIDKEDYERALALEIHGHLRPVKPWAGDSLEDYVDGVRLVIRQNV